MPRCNLCFKEKSPLQKVLPKCDALVCKGCFYELDRIIGFLEHYGVNIASYQAGLFTPKPPKHPKPSKSKSKPIQKPLNGKVLGQG